MAFSRKFVLFTLIIFLLSLQLLAGEGDYSGYVKGKMDGEAAAVGNKTWFLAGCLLGVVGVLGAYLVEPSVPTEILLGKDTDYILGYSEGYQKKSAKLNAKYATTGCVTFYVAYFGFYAIALSSASTN